MSGFAVTTAGIDGRRRARGGLLLRLRHPCTSSHTLDMVSLQGRLVAGRLVATGLIIAASEAMLVVGERMDCSLGGSCAGGSRVLI